MLIIPQRSKKKNKKAIRTKSQALSLRAQGAINISPSPCKAAPIGRWSKTNNPCERIKSKLARYLKNTKEELFESIY